MKSKILILIFIVLVAFVIFSKKEKEVPVLAEYPERVVYTTDLSVPEDPLIGDCQARGGEFNSCGSPCSDSEELCTAVCAYTCEL